jgi:hypothetical protein
MPQPNLGRTGNHPSEAFAESEYGVVRELIKEGLREIWTMERYALVAIAAFWAWLFAQGDWRPWMGVAKHVPAALAILAGLRCFAAYVAVKRLARYVKEEIEPRWGLGWERFNETHGLGILTGLIAAFWLLLITACLFVGDRFEASWLVAAAKAKP